MTKIILADNQDLTRAGLRQIVASRPEAFQVVEVSRKAELVETLRRLDGKAVVIIDYTLFDLKSIEEMAVISRRFPAARWVLLSGELTQNMVRDISLWEEMSIVFKDAPRQDIEKVIDAAATGQRYLAPQAEDMLHPHRDSNNEEQSPLSASEISVLKLIARGMTVKEIAAERSSSIHTIITHKKNIFRKIGVNTIHEATRYALRTGLVELMEYYI